MTTIQERRVLAVAKQDLVVAEPAPLFVQACPGAGKTSVIVRRHLAAGPSAGRLGRALVSFTNVACAEMERRCRAEGRQDAVAFPNFVGTIDTFFWRYLVRPFLKEGRVRKRIESWDQINAKVMVYGSRPLKLRLGDFNFRYRLAEKRCVATYRPKNFVDYRTLETEELLDEAGKAAVDARNKYADDGYVTGHEIRINAWHFLQRNAPEITAVLRARFAEVVIDEAQDCSDLDLAILEALREGGLPMVFVCDPEQAIYEFRGAEPEKAKEFGSRLDRRIDLTGNWRSSPAICALAATLRPLLSERPADTPVGDHHDEATGVLLIPTVKGTALAVDRFAKQAAHMGIPPQNRLILAHAGNQLPAVSHKGRPAPQDPAARLAWAAVALTRPDAPLTQRRTALEIAERTLLHFWYDRTDGKTVDVLCEDFVLDRLYLQRTAARLAHALPVVDDRSLSDWCKEANKVLKAHCPDPSLVREGRRGNLTAGRKVAKKSVSEAAGVVATGAHPGTRVSIVHQAKGEEADAVLVIIPAEDRTQRLIDAWISGTHVSDVAESMRVVYVAATRARRLLALAVPEIFCDKVAAHLESMHVPLIR